MSFLDLAKKALFLPQDLGAAGGGLETSEDFRGGRSRAYCTQQSAVSYLASGER